MPHQIRSSRNRVQLKRDVDFLYFSWYYLDGLRIPFWDVSSKKEGQEVKKIVVVWVGLVMLVCAPFRAEAAVPVTQGVVTETASTQSVRTIIPPTALANIGFSSPTIFRVDNLDGSSTFAMNGTSEFKFHESTFGSLGTQSVPQDFIGFGLDLSAIGRPEMIFKYLWGPLGTTSSFDSLAFTIVNNDSWTGYIRKPEGLGDPFGFSVSLACSSNPCSAQVTPYFASAPVPEPHTSALLLAGLVIIGIRISRRKQEKRIRVIT